MSYAPRPMDTSNITLPEDLQRLIERLAENVHDLWACQRLADGWTYGPCRDDLKKEHPCLVPYAALPEVEKQYDRVHAREILKATMALGYELKKRGGAPSSAEGESG